MIYLACNPMNCTEVQRLSFGVVSQPLRNLIGINDTEFKLCLNVFGSIQYEWPSDYILEFYKKLKVINAFA